MRLIDADAISKIMYRKAFEEDSDLQRWDNMEYVKYCPACGAYMEG